MFFSNSFLLVLTVLRFLGFSSVHAVNSWPKIAGGNIPKYGIKCIGQLADGGSFITFEFTHRNLFDILNGPGYAGFKTQLDVSGLTSTKNWTMQYQPQYFGAQTRTVTINWAVNAKGIVTWGDMYSTVAVAVPAPVNSVTINLPCL